MIKEYLEKVNENGKVRFKNVISLTPSKLVNSDAILRVLEYTLFQPGLFLDYPASPYKTAKYVTPLGTIDFQKQHVIVIEGIKTLS